MRLKSYYVQTIEEALQVAKLELGDEAMLVDSKRMETPGGGRNRLEVIFASPILPPAPRKTVSPPVRMVADSSVGLRRFRGELATLLDALRSNPDVTRLEPYIPAREQLNALRERLRLSEVPAAIVDETLQKCRLILEGLALRGVTDREESLRAILPIMSSETRHPPETEGRRVLAFVGPRGGGKSSAVAKLAFHFGLSLGEPIRVISIDNARVGAGHQLAHVCSLLGVPFESLDHSRDLRTVFNRRSPQEWTLIDTSGYGSTDADEMEETAAQLHQIESLATHLVLPATLRYSELRRHYGHFSVFKPSQLLFTRWDETEYFGPAWALARGIRLPVLWITRGPGIADDMDKADSEQLAAAVLGLVDNGAHLRPRPLIATAAQAGGGASRN